MSALLVDKLLSFQPDAPELKTNLEYHSEARKFVQEVATIAAVHFADTPQDVLEVPIPTTL